MKLRTSCILMLLGFLALSLSGCEEDRQSGAAGRLSLRLSADGAVTDVTTRSADEDIPDVKDFSMTMLQGDKVQASWDKLADYDEDTTFPVGTYTVKASYGDMENEGFASPYYEGSTDVVIQSGTTTEVEATCKLANTKITIEYTDDFKSYFKTYSAKVKSELGSEITFKSDETRAAYVKSGRVSVKVTFTKATGGVGSSTVDVATIEAALPQHHYHLLMDVDAGKAMLSVVFDRVTEEKPITLDISDRALNIQAPYFTLTGFDKMSNEDNLWDGYPDVDKLSALMTSLGGFKHCILRTESPKLSWPEQGFDLADLKAGELEQITASGIKLTGFGENRGEMGIIDFTGVASALQVSENNRNHKFYLRVTSTYGKESEQYALNITLPKLCELLAAEPVEMGEKQVVLPVKLLEGDPKDVKLFYKVYGSWEQIANPTYVPVSGKPGYYDFTAKVDMGVSSKEFKAVYQGVDSRIVTVAVKVPDYTISLPEGDLWTREAIITVTPNNPTKDLSNIMKAIAVYYQVDNNSTWVKASPKKEGDKLIITNLAPNTSYSFKTTCNEGETYSSEVAGITESGEQIPNNNFTEGWETLFQENDIYQGGGYGGKTFLTRKQNKVNLNINNIGIVWATVNKKTVPTTPKTKNTWYIVPSTSQKDGDILLRNVGWADGLGNPETKYGGSGLFGDAPPTTLEDLAVPSPLYYSAGKFFLGSYGYIHINEPNSPGTETYTPGIEFTSRPKKLTGTYTYEPIAGDKGKVVVIVENRDNGVTTELANNTQELSEVKGSINVVLNYTNKTLKATHLRVLFTSSSADANDDKSVSDATIKPFVQEHKKEAVAYGSQLMINKGIKLEY